MYIVGALMLAIPRTCAFIFFVCFCYPGVAQFSCMCSLIQLQCIVGRFCIICVAHLPVSHVTALEMWQFSLAR